MDNAVTRSWLTQTGGLAWRLRCLREAAGLSGPAFADVTGWTLPKISKMENGRQFPTDDEVRQWGRACHADPPTIDRLSNLLESSKAVHLDYRRQADGGQLPVQRTYTLLYEASTRISKVETTVVPGPLQTVEYARTLMVIAAERMGLPLGDEQEAAQERSARYDLIVDRDRRVSLLIWEAALHLGVGSAEIMLEQLDRLQTIVDHPTIQFGVIPFAATVVEIPRAFSIFDDLVLVEGQGSATFEQSPEVTAGHRTTAERLWSMAITGPDARRLILAAADRHRS